MSSAEGWSDASSIPDGVGGPYWFLTVALPGFSSFRYPGKPLVIASLGLSGLSGIGWDEACRGSSRRPGRLALFGVASRLSGAFLLAMPVSRTASLTLSPLLMPSTTR